MGTSDIPVDLANPGQVFACLGFLEAADVLCGPAQGGFRCAAEECFVLAADGADDPVREVLAFLAGAEVTAAAPAGWDAPDGLDVQELDSFPALEADKMALPLILSRGAGPDIRLGHWADGSSRESFKLYAGNRSAVKIASDMIALIASLWRERRDEVVRDPLNTLCAMGGSFNFDPRGAWTAIDAGYSPNEHKHKVAASPVVEVLAAWGLEHARPMEVGRRRAGYAAWQELLPPVLARAVLSGVPTAIPVRRFTFDLALSGKNKVVQFAVEEAAA